MKAEVKSITSPDIVNFTNYFPEDETTFAFLMQIIVGIKGEKGGDSFNIEVCTPKWLLENNNSDDIIFGRHKLIVFEYNIERIIKLITKHCESCEGNNWEEIANKIARIALWEFEDYQINSIR